MSLFSNTFYSDSGLANLWSYSLILQT